MSLRADCANSLTSFLLVRHVGSKQEIQEIAPASHGFFTPLLIALSFS